MQYFMLWLLVCLSVFMAEETEELLDLGNILKAFTQIP